MTLLEVAVAAPIEHTLTYKHSERVSTELTIGQRLLVPLAGRLVTGYLLGFLPHTNKELEDSKLRPIADVLDFRPLFPESMIPFLRWIANYYHYPIGEVIKNALPGGLTVHSGRRIKLTKSGRAHFDSQGFTDEAIDYDWFDTLLIKGELSPGIVRRVWRTKDRRILVQWQEKGWVEIKKELTGGNVKQRTEVCVSLSADLIESALDPHLLNQLKPSEKKTLLLLRQFLAEADDISKQSIPRKDLIHEYSGARKALKGLYDRQLVAFSEKPIYRDLFGDTYQHINRPEKLTSEQAAALERLMPVIRKKEFAAFLLHGITGSGKTEVYLQAAAATLQESRSVMVLVPEIALATQLEAHFLSRFGDQVALLHSGLSPREQYDQWLRINNGEARVVIGARSAVFAPFSDLGIIIVDEEHDGAYKQEDRFCYQGRDLAILRASLEKIPVILGSATPSVTSYHHAKQGKYQLLTLKHRIEKRQLPSVTVVDLNNISTVSGAPPIFSPDLLAGLRANLKLHQQSLIFLNRRGYANLLLCKDCGKSIQCRNCQVTLTLHKHRGELLCHHCGYSRNSSTLCPHCKSTKFINVGFGTERLERDLKSIFPSARIARLDRDTAAKRKEYISLLKAMQKNQLDILVGTQMIAKGHHFPKVTLVGIVWADAGLGLPDYKAGERAFQLISQVTGRAGRGEDPGRVIIQTQQPKHYSIALAKDHDYFGMYERELCLREELGFPPFSRLINIHIAGDDESVIRTFAYELFHNAKKLNQVKPPVRILGPVPAPLARLHGKFRWQLLLQGAKLESLHRLCRELMQIIPGLPQARKIKVSVDVDPENML